MAYFGKHGDAVTLPILMSNFAPLSTPGDTNRGIHSDGKMKFKKKKTKKKNFNTK